MEKRSVLICGDLLWISISVTSSKLVDLVLVGSDCDIKALFFWCSTSEGIQSLEVVYEYICSVLDREVFELKYLSGSQPSTSN